MKTSDGVTFTAISEDIMIYYKILNYSCFVFLLLVNYCCLTADGINLSSAFQTLN